MNKNSKISPNILLTEVCNQSCRYCFARHEMKESAIKEMKMDDFERALDLLERSGQNRVRLMGGEPTLHSRFREIIDLSLGRGFSVNLFTNGFFSEELAKWLAECGGLVEYSVNLTVIALDNSSKKSTAEHNVEMLSQASKVYGSITVDPEMRDFSSVIALVEKNALSYVRIGIANNLVKRTDHNVAKDYKLSLETVERLVDELSSAGVSQIMFSCGFTPCMFQKEKLDQFYQQGVRMKGWGCDGKSSSFDITAGLEAFPCFIIDDLKIKNVTEFSDLNKADNYISQLFRYFINSTPLSCKSKCKRCEYFKKSQCSGPCLGYVTNDKDDKEAVEKMKKSLIFRLGKRIMYRFRDLL